jgi:hypothetical protein
MVTATKTADHDEIRKWAEARGGKPARVDAQGHKQGGGILRINFDEPGGDDDDRLEEISWEEWFNIFDENDLALLHQDETADGRQSRFNKLVSRSGEGG